jgi:hypothetical protein
LTKPQKTREREPLDWGAVKVIAGRHKGRIGHLDDEEAGGIVYFGDFF